MPADVSRPTLNSRDLKRDMRFTQNLAVFTG